MATVKDYFLLLKPRVMSLVVFTGVVGIYLAPGEMSPIMAIMATAFIALGSGAAGAFNMWYERDIDAKMLRTKNRPIPKGDVTPKNALIFSVICAITSVWMMATIINYLSALLLLGAILFYAIIYTIWLKPRTPQNIVVGGAAGAFPPIIGWATVTGNVSFESIALFLIIFMWTPPHFWALALYRCKDYEKVGIPMLPAVIGRDKTIKSMLVYAIILVAVSLLPYMLGTVSMIYLASAIILGSIFIAYIIILIKNPTDTYAKRTFFFSIFYLFILFSSLIIDRAIL